MDKVLWSFSKEHRETLKRFSKSKNISQVKFLRFFCELLEHFDSEACITIVACDNKKIVISEDLEKLEDYSLPHISSFSYQCRLATKETGEKQVTIEKGITVER